MDKYIKESVDKQLMKKQGKLEKQIILHFYSCSPH